MNNVTLTGHVGQDPELTHLKGGNTIAKFSLATNDGFGEHKKTNWHRLVCWNKTAELVEKYVSKGDKIGIIGRIEYDSYENKKGDKVYTTEIVVNSIEFLGSKQNVEQKEQSGVSVNGSPIEDLNDGDLPF